jgi:hypothetical protein
VVVGAAFAVVAALFVTSTGAEPQQDARVLDRTFRCTPVALGQRLRDVDIDAVPSGAKEGYNPAQPRSPGFVGVGTGSYAAASELVVVRAREWWRFETNAGPKGVWVSTKRCTASRASVPLSPKGLPGHGVRWSEHGTCLVRGGLLVRVRATLQSPAGWESDPTARSPGAVGAYSNVTKGALAVRSERTGRPIAFAELDAKGKTVLWYAPDCQ